jgi:hypothetical protein
MSFYKLSNSITVVLEQKRFVQPINSPVKEVHVLICHMCVIILMTVGTNRMKLFPWLPNADQRRILPTRELYATLDGTK